MDGWCYDEWGFEELIVGLVQCWHWIRAPKFIIYEECKGYVLGVSESKLEEGVLFDDFLGCYN